MRQEVKNLNGDVLVYGFDELEGIFFKITSYDGIVLEEDSQENNEKLNVAVVASIAEDYGFLLSEELIEDVIEIE